MAKTDFQSVDQYLATKSPEVRKVLQQVRSAIHQAVPGGEDVISYQIPAYKVHGAAAIYYSGWKEHYSLYPASAGLVAALEEELAPYEVEKGTIRFPYTRPVPVRLIGRIAKFRAQEAEQRAATKAKVKAATRKKKR
jgi:uncharacterized protein YdhG (YjbR/CyaY superfamily)